MYRLPTKNDLGARPTPQVSSSIARYSAAGVEERALENLGNTVEKIGSDFQDRRDARELAVAKSEFIRQSITASNAFEDDPDPDTYEKRYTEMMQKAKNTAASSIKNAQNRALFEEQIKIDIARGEQQIKGLADKKRGDYARATLADTLEQNTDALLRAKTAEDRAALLAATEDAVLLTADDGHISYEQAQKQLSGFESTYAIARYNSMTSQEQYEALKKEQEKGGTWMRSIPAPKRAELMAQAQKEVEEHDMRQKAQETADTILYNNPTDYEAQVSQARQIKDAQVRSKVMTHLDSAYAQREKIRKQAKTQQVENAVNLVLEGGSINDIPERDWVAMDENDRKSLEKIQRRRDGLEPTDDNAALEFYDTIATDYARNPKSIAKYSLAQLQANVPPEKLDKVLGWRQDVASGNVVPDATQGQINAIIRDTTEMLEIKDKQKQARLRQAVEIEVEQFTKTNGKKPSYSDTITIRDRLVEQITFDKFFDEEKYRFELTGEEEFSDVVVPEKDRKLILESWQKANGDQFLSEDQIKAYYIKGLVSK